MSERIVHLMRHGEVHNPGHVLYGRLPDFRLSALGERQAVETAAWLAARPVARIVASPLLRAQQTARPLAEATGLDVRTDERLIEAGNRFEGQRTGPGMFLRPGNWWYLRNPRRPSWGEPYLQIAQRVRAAVLAAATGEGEAVCVTHQLPVVAHRRYTEGRVLAHDPRARVCALASVTTFAVSGRPGTEVVRLIGYAEPAAQAVAQDMAGA